MSGTKKEYSVVCPMCNTKYKSELRDDTKLEITYICSNEKCPSNKMNKEKALEFAKKYLSVRRNDCTIETYFKDPVDAAKRAWDIAVEYTILDIIPYLYGDALD